MLIICYNLELLLFTTCRCVCVLQWNLAIPATLGMAGLISEVAGLISEVAGFQCMFLM